jgi:hypothetical protein
MKIIRVFPRRTRATPDDEDVRVGMGPGLFDVADAVHISVTFSWDLPSAEKLADAWKNVGPVSMGGPATGAAGGDFIPGQYLKRGYVITSRGCPNRCWFCSVWKREGDIREIPICEGHNVLDDNLLACSDDHILSVFSMLWRQPKRPIFTGGIEAARLKPWHAKALRGLRPKSVFFAYDTPDDAEPLREAGRMMLEAGFTIASHVLRCYVLIGYPRDTFDAAEARARFAMSCGFSPMAMLYRDSGGITLREWRAFQRQWARPTIIHAGNKPPPYPQEA